MNGITSRERMLIIIGVGVSLLIGVPALLGDPASSGSSLSSLKQKRRESQAQIARLRRENEELAEAIERRISKGTPRQLVQRMVQSSQTAAKMAGLRIEDLKPVTDDGFAGLQRVSLQMSLNASFADAVRFLYELERAGRLSTAGFQVDDLQMVAADPHSDTLDLELRLIGFVKPEEQEDGTGS